MPKNAAASTGPSGQVWNEFFQDWNGMAYDSQMKHPRLRETVLAWDDIAAIPPGRTRDAVIQARVNQDFFRQMVLAQFDELVRHDRPARQGIAGVPPH